MIRDGIFFDANASWYAFARVSLFFPLRFLKTESTFIGDVRVAHVSNGVTSFTDQ